MVRVSRQKINTKSLPYHRYAAEFVGTFWVVFAPVALSSTLARFPHVGTNLVASALVSGLSVLTMVYTLGRFGGAHFNPAVTMGFLMAGFFEMSQVLPYWIAQISGSVVAGGVSCWLRGRGYGIPALNMDGTKAVALEAALTFLLMLVILAVATEQRMSPTMPGIAIGAAVVVGVLIGGPLTGGCMNPVRFLGPALFASGSALGMLWIYLLGPILGAILAAGFYKALKMSLPP